jgi:hypothetical protein
MFEIIYIYIDSCVCIFMYKRTRTLQSDEINASVSNLRRYLAPVHSTLVSRRLLFLIGFANRSGELGKRQKE